MGGKMGIEYIKTSIANIDVANSEASVKADEDKVKGMISSTVGFAQVNNQVAHSITTWVGQQLRIHIDSLLEEPIEQQHDGEMDEDAGLDEPRRQGSMEYLNRHDELKRL